MENRQEKYWRELIRVIEWFDDRVCVCILAYSSKNIILHKEQFDEASWFVISAFKGRNIVRFFGQVQSDAESISEMKIKEVETPKINLNIYTREELLGHDHPQETLIDEIIRLREAIKTHQAASVGHGMCWENDQTLWQAIDENAKFPHETVPGKEEFLGQCARYHESRVKGLPHFESDVKTHAVTKDGKII